MTELEEKQKEVLEKIQKLLEESNLKLVIDQIIRVIPKE